jgi:hypothetical protein
MATDSIPFAADAETPLPPESLEVGIIYNEYILAMVSTDNVIS